MCLQGLNVLVLTAVVGGLGYVAKKYREGRPQKPLGTVQAEADTSSGEEEGDVGEESTDDSEEEDTSRSPLQDTKEKRSASDR